MDVPLFRLTKLKEWTRVTWLLWLSLFVGIAAHLFYPYQWWPYETTKALADGFIVAGVIGLSLELAAANFLIAKVGDALVGKLAGSTLPPELQGKIREIVHTAIVRENYSKIYSLSLKDGQMEVEATISFDVRNYSEKAEEYVPEMDEEEFFHPEFLRLEYKTKDKQYVVTDFVPEPKFEGTRTLQVAGKKKVKLRSFHLDKNSKCSVIWKYRATMPVEFCDVNEFRYATINPKFRLASIPDGFEFIFVGGNLLPRSPESTVWEFAESFITGQQVRAQWVKKSSQQGR